MTFGEGLARKSKFLARNNKRRLRCISATPAGNRVLRTRAAIALPLTGEEAPPHFGRLFGRRPRREGVPPCSKEGANMRFFIAVGLLALLASPSLAQNCNIIGNSTFCDNGLSANRIGNSTFFSDGTSANRIGNSTFFSDGTSANRIGNSTFYSDGTSANQIGNTTFFSNGRSCNRIGNSVFCN